MSNTEYTPEFKKQVLEVTTLRACNRGGSDGWFTPELGCGCPLTELARANGLQFVPGVGTTVLNFLHELFGYESNMMMRFVDQYDNTAHDNPHSTPYECAKAVFANAD